MLEDERYRLGQLKDELRATAEEGERLARVLARLDIIEPATQAELGLGKSSVKRSDRLLEVLPRRNGKAVRSASNR